MKAICGCSAGGTDVCISRHFCRFVARFGPKEPAIGKLRSTVTHTVTHHVPPWVHDGWLTRRIPKDGESRRGAFRRRALSPSFTFTPLALNAPPIPELGQVLVSTRADGIPDGLELTKVGFPQPGHPIKGAEAWKLDTRDLIV